MVHFTIPFAGLMILASTAYACDGLYQCKYASGEHCCLLPGTGYGPKNCPTKCDGGSAFPPECVADGKSLVRTNCHCGSFKDKCTS
ncbi:hypothetical protein BDZ85DRAFT_261523 [Elsinoe ampelina]|uniref:Uncharacterized protein n=1 Tax=Elsinoe ampelina TaxID=302913 RepID=A0A6A6GCK4_9PEZI|nr:hypothetical protein BDZ85DRAFT_261523 [Elsinoe ampelina]